MGIKWSDNCVHCGKKIGIVIETEKSIKLTDGKRLCSKCMKCIKPYMEQDVMSYWNYEEYQHYLAYLQNVNDYIQKFYETHSYKSIHLDSNNGWFYISEGPFKGLNKNTLIYDMRMIYNVDFPISYYDSDYKEGIMTSKLKVKVEFTFSSALPKMSREMVLDYNGAYLIKKDAFGKIKNKDYEPKLRTFLDVFNTTYYKFSMFKKANVKEENNNNYDSSSSENSNQNNTYEHTYREEKKNDDVNKNRGNELENARILFMIDDLNTVTIEDIKKQRNRLIKVYHPDGESNIEQQYSQKINEAYEKLKNYVESR